MKEQKRMTVVKETKKDPTKVSEDNPEWTEEDFKAARPVREVLPELFGKEMAEAMLKKRGRPKKKHPKVSITIRLDEDVVKKFRAGGEGWQTDINNALREWIATHEGN